MPLFARALMVAAGVLALAAGRYRYRTALDSAAEAERVGAIPRQLRTVAVYRGAAIVTAAVGVVFVLLGLLAGW